MAIGMKIFKIFGVASGCYNFGQEIYEYGNFLFQNYGLVEFTKNFRKNISDNQIQHDIIGLMARMGSGLFARDYDKIGMNFGSIFYILYTDDDIHNFIKEKE